METNPKSDEEMDICKPENNQELLDGELDSMPSDSKLGSDSIKDTQLVCNIEAPVSAEDETPDLETQVHNWTCNVDG